jgi:hypothetical protein
MRGDETRSLEAPACAAKSAWLRGWTRCGLYGAQSYLSKETYGHVQTGCAGHFDSTEHCGARVCFLFTSEITKGPGQPGMHRSHGTAATPKYLSFHSTGRQAIFSPPCGSRPDPMFLVPSDHSVPLRRRRTRLGVLAPHLGAQLVLSIVY